MEFFLIPLIAISLMTFGIYKLTAMIFHIYLSGRLLLLLVVFAWMVSLVLPGLFYHTAGFLGSVGISLVSAVGFAWLATTVDSKHHSAQMASVASNGAQMQEMSVWAPPAENAAPMLPREEWTTAPVGEKQEEFPVVDQIQVIEEILHFDLTEVATVNAVTVELEPVVELEPQMGDSIETLEAVADADEIVSPPNADRILVQDVSVIADACLFAEDEQEQQELLGEPVVMAAMSESKEEHEEPVEVSIDEETLLSPEADAEELLPSSDSLEDLLEFAFLQRTQNNANGALVTFRRIRSMYEDSQALPMVVAEVVSTLQSQGNYNEAISELMAILRLPAIQQDVRLVRTFEQKLNYLQVLNAILNERGSPFLPFDQIPAEWQKDIEQGLLTRNRV